MDNILGARIKQLREKNNLSQKQLAEQLGITNVQLSRYESGGRKPDPDTITTIAAFFGVMTDYLLGRHDKIYDPQELYITEEDRQLIQVLKKHPEFRQIFKEMVAAPDSKIITFMKIWELLKHDNPSP